MQIAIKRAPAPGAAVPEPAKQNSAETKPIVVESGEPSTAVPQPVVDSGVQALMTPGKVEPESQVVRPNMGAYLVDGVLCYQHEGAVHVGMNIKGPEGQPRVRSASAMFRLDGANGPVIVVVAQLMQQQEQEPTSPEPAVEQSAAAPEAEAGKEGGEG